MKIRFQHEHGGGGDESIVKMTENLIWDEASRTLDGQDVGITEVTKARVKETGFALGRLLEVLAQRGILDAAAVWYVASGGDPLPDDQITLIE